MNNRSPVAVFFLTLFTAGIYGIVWFVKTKDEMNELGAEIPTLWWVLVPFAYFWWMWKYSEGVAQVTEGTTSAGVAYLMLLLLGPVGQAIMQNSFNSVTADPEESLRITIEGAGA